MGNLLRLDMKLRPVVSCNMLARLSLPLAPMHGQFSLPWHETETGSPLQHAKPQQSQCSRQKWSITRTLISAAATCSERLCYDTHNCSSSSANLMQRWHRSLNRRLDRAASNTDQMHAWIGTSATHKAKVKHRLSSNDSDSNELLHLGFLDMVSKYMWQTCRAGSVKAINAQRHPQASNDFSWRHHAGFQAMPLCKAGHSNPAGQN